MLEKIILRNKKDDSWRIFSSPLEVLYTHDLNYVKDVLNKVQNKVEKKKLIAAGYLSYEAAPAFDNAYSVNEKGSLPLICFGLFKDYKIEKTFNPGTATAPWSGYTTHINDESKLRNQFFALQKSEQGVYIPPSNSDLYVDTIENDNEGQPFPHLFKKADFELFNPNKCELGKEIFHNNTRVQLKNT